MSIAGLANELQEINIEITRRRKELRKLNSRKKKVVEEINNYNMSRGHPGIKYQGSAYITESKEVCIRRKNADKEDDGRKILEKYGIPNSDKILAEVMNAMKKTEEKTVLTVKKIKNN